MAFCVAEARTQSIVQAIPFPNTTYWNQAYDLATDSTGMYVSSSTSTTTLYNYGYIYKIDSTGARVDSIATGLGQSQGLASDGVSFYFVRRYTSTCTIFRITRTGAVMDSLRFVSPTRLIGGAVWDGGSLWVSDYSPTTSTGRPAVLLRIDWANKTIVDSVITIGLQPMGVTWDQEFLYYAMDMIGTEPNLNLIYVVNPSNGDTNRTIMMPEPPTVDSNPRGLAWDGRHLWLIARPVGGGTGQVLYKYDLGGSGTPDIHLPVTSLDFGGVRVGQQRDINFSIQNVGTAPLSIDSIRILLSGNFVVAAATPFVIQPDSARMFPVTFTPPGFGSDSASMRIHSNDPDERVRTVPLRGMGIYGDPTIGVPAELAWGPRRVFSTNSRKFTIVNQGGGTLTITSIALSNPAFRLDNVVYPVNIDSLGSRVFRVWFNPTSAVPYLDTLKITSNASNGTVTNVATSGTGDNTPLPIGTPLWTHRVVNHPISNTFRLVKGVRAISDLSGNEKPDVIVSTENYWTMALNANASGDTDSLWAFTTYISNSSAGSIGSTGSYSYQKAMAIASDLNGDGVNDVVIGTGGGNERVYAISGRTGQMLWSFGTDHPDSFSLGDFDGVDVSLDFNGDGVPDVVAAAGATQTGGLGGRRSVYLFNGTTGAIMWVAPLLGFTHGVVAVPDISGDGIPDVVATVGEAAYKASAFSGANGGVLWDFPLASGSGGGKEVILFPVPGMMPDVIMSAFWGPIYRLHGETGTAIWSNATGGSGVLQLKLLRDVTGDGVPEVVAVLLGGGARCINGATGSIIWSLPTGNTMGVDIIPDLNQDGFDEVVIAAQNEGMIIVRGQSGVQLGSFTGFGSNQYREVAVVPDMDGNGSSEIIVGSQQGDVALISGGLGTLSADLEPALPTGFSLSQNFPNPFNPSTAMTIQVPHQEHLTVAIYDILGREVKVFDFERAAPGTHTITWDGMDRNGKPVATGVYLYRAILGELSITKRMMLLK